MLISSQNAELGHDDDQNYDADVDDIDEDDMEDHTLISDEADPKPGTPPAKNEVYLEDPENDPVDDEISDFDDYFLACGHGNFANLDNIDSDLDQEDDDGDDIVTDSDDTSDISSSSAVDDNPIPRRRANSI